MRACFFFGLVAVLAPLLPPSRAAAADTPPSIAAETLVLPNGLRIALAPDATARLVSVAVEYAAGSADDPPGKRGLAHLSEHVLFRELPGVTAPYQFLTNADASDFQGQTARDWTNYSETIPPEKLESVLWFEAVRMAHRASSSTDAVVRSERANLTNEHTDGENRMLGAQWPAVEGAIYPRWHPYDFSEPDDLGSIELADVRAFLDTWYTPSNATVAIAGRFNRDEAVAAIKRYFGPIASRRVPARPELPPWSALPGRVDVAAPVLDYRVALAWVTPPLGKTGDGALDVVAGLLAAPGELLDRPPLVPAVTQWCFAHQFSQRLGSMFVVMAQVQTSDDVARALSAFRGAVRHVAKSTTDDDVARIVRNFSRSREVGRSRTAAVVGRLLLALRLGQSPGPAFDFGMDQYRTLTAADVRAAAQQYLDESRAVTAFVYPDVTAPHRGWAFRHIDDPVPSE